ncbi:hypothetical protein [Mesorhizobium sp. CO1-1-4]|uniref:hypothetical protein n=1 Tax=Mesorhizobium sp. CO1-1-4 TaxID=2876633 RepID=UPI001CCCF45F|nr:hypothetical protein [Mesorhizobium sp. CO1-1-4]MBZ9742233.1 hypothetical protein [Mesorhizobium sp. CO1-1-4]
MADSVNSMPLSFVTRRKVLTGASIAMLTLSKNAGAPEVGIATALDPAVEVWRAWQNIHHLTDRLCRKQQRLETRLVKSVGFPHATIQLSGGERVTLHSLDMLRRIGSDDLSDPARAKAESDFTAHQARWDVADEEIGYSATLSAEREAGERAEDLLDILSKTPATSLAGVLAKLDAVLRDGQASDDVGDLSWPLIRSVRDDLTQIGKDMVPEQVFPEKSVTN